MSEQKFFLGPGRRPITPNSPTMEHPFRDPETGRDFPESMDLELSLKFHDLVQQWGIEGALEIAVHCAAMVKHDLTEADVQRLRRMLMYNQFAVNLTGGSDLTQRALNRTYFLLYSRRLKTWGEAAELARTILKREDPIDPETWRRRVSRWAEKQGYPKIELYPRRTEKTEPLDDE